MTGGACLACPVGGVVQTSLLDQINSANRAESVK